jgi:hypothetical protein
MHGHILGNIDTGDFLDIFKIATSGSLRVSNIDYFPDLKVYFIQVKS